MAKKYVYFFGDGKANVNTGMKNLVGGKGVNLAEIAGHEKLKLPVLPGLSMTAELSINILALNILLAKLLKSLFSRKQLNKIKKEG